MKKCRRSCYNIWTRLPEFHLVTVLWMSDVIMCEHFEEPSENGRHLMMHSVDSIYEKLWFSLIPAPLLVWELCSRKRWRENPYYKTIRIRTWQFSCRLWNKRIILFYWKLQFQKITKIPEAVPVTDTRHFVLLL